MSAVRFSRLKRRGAACFLLGSALFALSGAVPAAAVTPVVAVWVGSGTITPALSLAPAQVTGGFDGSIVGAAVVNGAPIAVLGVNGCSLSFMSSAAGDDLISGAGSASASCGGTADVNAATLAYVRSGEVMVLQGSATIAGASGVGTTALTMVCAFEPTSAPAIVSYTVECSVLGE